MSAPTTSSIATEAALDAGLATSMQAVLRLHEQARTVAIDSAVGVELVHDLRVALRRCRSLAQGLVDVDVAEAGLWKKLNKVAKPLFSGLGAIRDAQVMRGHVDELVVDDAVKIPVIAALDDEIAARAVDAAAAVAAFDVEAFAALSTSAPARAAALRRRRPVLLHLALTRHAEGRALHVEAMRRRTPESLHDTRIGVKRLRYTLESLLPDLHAEVSKPLKKMQAALGDVHDFDVLVDAVVAMAPTLGVDDTVIVAALAPVHAVRAQRLAAYKALSTGRSSAWAVVRAVLPTDPLVVARCRKAYVLDVAAALGVDRRTARRAERAFEFIAKALGVDVGDDDEGRIAAVFAASRHRKRARRACRALLGFSSDERRRLRVRLVDDHLAAAAGLAASDRSARRTV